MALQKAIQTAFGIDVSYWKICSIKADYWSNTMVANMNAWPSMQERMTGNAPIATREFIWTNVDFPAEESASSNTTSVTFVQSEGKLL